jgi:predicted PhzF superfamily epimerase YddE/YHI9
MSLVTTKKHLAALAVKDAKIASLQNDLTSATPNAEIAAQLATIRANFDSDDEDFDISAAITGLSSELEAGEATIATAQQELTASTSANALLTTEVADLKAAAVKHDTRIDAVAKSLGLSEAGDANLSELIENLEPEGRTNLESLKKLSVETGVDESILTEADVELAELK